VAAMRHCHCSLRMLSIVRGRHYNVANMVFGKATLVKFVRGNCAAEKEMFKMYDLVLQEPEGVSKAQNLSFKCERATGKGRVPR
jgi:hypothetical protein